MAKRIFDVSIHMNEMGSTKAGTPEENYLAIYPTTTHQLAITNSDGEVNELYNATNMPVCSDTVAGIAKVDGTTMVAVEGVLSTGSSVVTNPMTDIGDMIIGGENGTASNLPAGDDGQFLMISSGSPAWEDSVIGHVVTDATTTYTARANLQFTGGCAITDNLEGNTTVVNMSDPNKADLVGGLVPASELPSYVDDVIDLVTVAAAAPTEGLTDGCQYFNTVSKLIFTYDLDTTSWDAGASAEPGKIYVADDTNYCYRWTGAAMILISTGPYLFSTGLNDVSGTITVDTTTLTGTVATGQTGWPTGAAVYTAVTGRADTDLSNLSATGLAKFAAVPLIAAVSSTAGALTLNLSAAEVFTTTITETTTIAISNAKSAPIFNSLLLRITNGGAYTVSYPANTKYNNGIPPVLSVAGTDLLVLHTVDGGTNWDCIQIAQNLS